jgi:PAS domain S-box-containing protein
MTAENFDLGKNIDEKLFRLLVTHVEDYAIFMIDPNGYIMSWNQGAQRIHGFNEQEIIGRHISVFYTPDDIRNGAPLNNINTALRKGSYEHEGWRLRKDGSLFWANVVFTTIYDEKGRLTGFAKIVRDVTERKNDKDRREAQNARLTQKVKDHTQKMLANELRFRQLIENSYDGISLINYKHDVIYRSLSAERINGWTDKDIACNHMEDLVHPDDRHILKETFDQLERQPGIPVKTIFRTKHKKGYYIWTECVYTNWLDDVNISAIVCNFRDITERVLADEEIRKKTQQVENILESITDGFIALDNNLCYTYANKAMGEILGMSPDELIGKNLFELFPEAVNSTTYGAFNKALKTQQYTSNVDYYAPLKLWYENHIYPSSNGLSIFVRDITLSKHNEELQQRNQEAAETQAAILNALPPNIALLDENYKIITVNDSWKKFTLHNNLGLPNYGVGYNYLAFCEKAMGMNDQEGNKVAKGIRAVVKGQKNIYTLEYPWTSGHEKRWYQLVVAPLSNNKYKGAVVIHINITDKMNAEVSLAQSEANLRSVFENTDLSIVLFDNELKIVSFNNNAATQAVYSFGRKLKRGAPAFTYLLESRREVIMKALGEIAKTGRVNYETIFTMPDGTNRWYDVTWMGVTRGKEERIGYILTLRNITDRKHAEMERDKTTADLIKRNADLEQFTYIISHNLRAPVANIIGLSNLLEDVEVKNDDDAKILKSLNTSVTNLDNVIIDLNHILQVKSEIEGQMEAVELTRIIRDITNSIDHIIKQENVVVKLDLAVKSISSVKEYLHSIFYNLIVNSIKYKRTGVSPVIAISSRLVNGKVVIKVKDNGKGIDLEKNSEHLFGLYKRFDFSVEGKGMGLFMVKKQVESLGGSINVESQPERGAEFILEFPAGDDRIKKDR